MTAHEIRLEADVRQRRRAIDFHEGDKINEQAFKKLIRDAIALNQTKSKKRSA